MFKSRVSAALTIAGVSMLTGCASLIDGSNQVVSVDALHKGQSVSGTTCQLNNGKGVFYVTTPGTVTVHRAYADMNVKCEKEGRLTGFTAVKSMTKPLAFGNILFGGVIGVAVDAGTGAAYDYPTLITVLMDEISTMATPGAAPASKADIAEPIPVAHK